MLSASLCCIEQLVRLLSDAPSSQRAPPCSAPRRRIEPAAGAGRWWRPRAAACPRRCCCCARCWAGAGPRATCSTRTRRATRTQSPLSRRSAAWAKPLRAPTASPRAARRGSRLPPPSRATPAVPGLAGRRGRVRAQQARAGGAALAALALHAGRADATRRGFFLALCQVRPRAARWQATAAWRTGLSGSPLTAGGPLRDGAPLPAARASHVPAPGEGLARGERGAACV